MHEIDERARVQLTQWIAEYLLPCRIEQLEKAIESRDAEHLQRDREEATEILLGASPLLVRFLECRGHLMKSHVEVCDFIVPCNRSRKRLGPLQPLHVRDDHTKSACD